MIEKFTINLLYKFKLNLDITYGYLYYVVEHLENFVIIRFYEIKQFP